MRVIFTKTKFFCGLAALILAVAPMQLSAQQSSSDNNGAYMGLGYLHIDVESATIEGIHFTGDGDGLELLLGYRFTDNFSAEISYIDADYNLKGNGINIGDATADGILAKLLVHGNLSRFNPFIGIVYGDVEYDVNLLGVSGQVDDSGVAYIIGADMAASDNLSVRLSYETCGDCDDFLFIGPIYRF
ncbi:MAG: outer membrane beta-barrel protein [Parvibaculales bacterium]